MIPILGLIFGGFLLYKIAMARSDIFTFAGQKYNIRPSLLKAIAQVESGFNPYAQGGAGEVGMFQMKKKAFEDAKMYGGLSGEWPDALYDPRTAAMYAAAYLGWIRAQGIVGDLDILRAYNQGVEGSRRSSTAGLAYAQRVLNAEKNYV